MKAYIKLLKSDYLIRILLLVIYIFTGYFVTIAKQEYVKEVLWGITSLGVLSGLFTTIISIVEAKKVQKYSIVVLDLLLLVIIYASLYSCIYSISRESFRIEENGIPYFDFLYFSFITFTTVGYGDVLPISYFAKFVSASESFVFVCIISFAVMNFSDSIKKHLSVFRESE